MKCLSGLNSRLISLILVLTVFTTYIFADETEADKNSHEVHSLFQKLQLKHETDPGSYTKKLMAEFHLDEKESPFTYAHDTEFYNKEIGHAIPLHPLLEKLAHDAHGHLNNSFFYKDLGLLKNPLKVRQQQLKKRKNSKERVSTFKVTTRDGEKIEGTYFDRDSDNLIVIGAGFTNNREQMAPFGDMFTDSDVVFFDYRGHGAIEEALLKPQTWKGTFQRLFGIDRTKVKLGLTEELDVLAVVNHMRRQKNYTQVTGLGICYSAMIFIKAAALYPHLFDKLICDGTWLSLGHATNALSADLKMICSPQRGGAANWFVSKNDWFRKNMLTLAQKLFGIEFNTLSVLDYAPNLPDIPMLFIHGKDDIFISRKQFETIWHATNVTHKTAMLTSHEHVWNHLKGKELYKEICELFMHKTHEQFSQILVDPTALVEQKAHSLKQLINQ